MVQGAALSRTPPEPLVYEYDEETTLEGFNNVSSGDSSLAAKALVDIFLRRMGIYTFDLNNITRLSDWYTPVHTSAESLIAALTNHPGGDVSVNDNAFIFILLAEERLAKAKPPVTPNKEQAEALRKIKIAAAEATASGQSISVNLSQKEAKSLASFLQAGLPHVIPGDLRPEALSSQADAVNQRYQSDLVRLPDLLLKALGGK